MNDEVVIVGKVVNVHGIKGYVSIMSFTEPKDNLLNYKTLLWDHHQQWQSLPPFKIQQLGKKILMQIGDCVDRDLARVYIGTQLGVRREDLPDLPEGEYYWSSLEGLEVLDLADKHLGYIDRLFATGANDVIVVKDDAKEHLIPYVLDKVIVKVDLAARKMWVDWDVDY